MSSRKQAAQSRIGALSFWPTTYPTSPSEPWCRDWLRLVLEVSRPASELRMTTLADPDLPPATDGEIAATNLESARRRAWERFTRDPQLPGAAEAVVTDESLAAQFF